MLEISFTVAVQSALQIALKNQNEMRQKKGDQPRKKKLKH